MEYEIFNLLVIMPGEQEPRLLGAIFSEEACNVIAYMLKSMGIVMDSACVFSDTIPQLNAI